MLMDRPHWGRVTLKPFSEGLSEEEWRRFYRCFRDPEIAEWNGSRPLRMPLWLFKRVVMGEVNRGDRLGFGILDEQGEWLGSVELYELGKKEATLGILIGAKDRWGQGYGTEALRAVLLHAFSQMDLERVKLRTYRHNMRAQRAFQKAGFHEVCSPPAPRMNFGPRMSPQGGPDVQMCVTKEEWEGYTR